MWGRTGWQKVVICIVADGRAKIDRQVLNVLGIMGVYQDGVMKDHVNEKAVTAHIFEYTTHIVVTPDFKVRGAEEGTVPIQILFCLKERNAKKVYYNVLYDFRSTLIDGSLMGLDRCFDLMYAC